MITLPDIDYSTFKIAKFGSGGWGVTNSHDWWIPHLELVTHSMLPQFGEHQVETLCWSTRKGAARIHARLLAGERRFGPTDQNGEDIQPTQKKEDAR